MRRICSHEYNVRRCRWKSQRDEEQGARGCHEYCHGSATHHREYLIVTQLSTARAPHYNKYHLLGERYAMHANPPQRRQHRHRRSSISLFRLAAAQRGGGY